MSLSRSQRLFAFFLFLILLFVGPDVTECVHVFLGEAVTFPAIENCPTAVNATLYRIARHGAELQVAVRERGVWKPTEDYRDRVNQSAGSFGLSSTFYTDSGLYVYGCGSREDDMQLDVFLGSEASFTAGGPAELQCYYSTTGKHVDSIRWVKDQEDLVLEVSLSSGHIKYGTGFNNDTVSLPPDGVKYGDWSLRIHRVLLEHRGDYFCSAHTQGTRMQWGDPAAVRVEVTERQDPDQTTSMGTWAIVSITAAVVILIVAPVAFLLGRNLKPRCSGVSSCFSDRQYSGVALQPPQTNGHGPLNNTHAQSTV